MKPMIGITSRRLSSAGLGRVPDGARDVPLEGIISAYAESVHAAGGSPVLLSRHSTPEDIVPLLDGLISSGGEDVDPFWYGEQPDEFATGHDPVRDEYEMRLLRVALAFGLPTLGICRGAQVLNVALGGTLVSHLPDVDGFSHATTDSGPSVLRHEVALVPGSAVADVYGDDIDDRGIIRVNSFHHQAVGELGEGLQVSGRAPDGTIEAIELAGRPVIAVQWHPEWHEGCDPVFHWTVGEASRYAASRA